MPKSYLIITSATAAALILGVIILTRPDNKRVQTQSATTSTSNSQPNQSNNPNNAQKESAATITYTDNGFQPGKVTVKSGDQITVKNDSPQSLQFSSDPHPIHTDNPQLNQSVLQPGRSQSFTVTSKGTWGYHDHLNEINTGTIIVE